MSQAPSSNWSRESTAPGFRMKSSSSANSFAESSTSSSLDQTRRAAGSSRKSPTVEDRRPLARCPACERAQPGEQLVEREGLGEIVVGTGVEPLDPVLDRVARCEHQHRRPNVARAQSDGRPRSRRCPAASRRARSRRTVPPAPSRRRPRRGQRRPLHDLPRAAPAPADPRASAHPPRPAHAFRHCHRKP